MEDFTKKKKKTIEKSTTIIYSFNTAYTIVVELTQLKKYMQMMTITMIKTNSIQYKQYNQTKLSK